MSKNKAIKTCGECKYFNVDDIAATCEKLCLICNDDNSACERFEQKVITNGDELAEDMEYMAAVIIAAHGTICPFCIYYKNKKCTAPKDKNCFHGVVGWLEQEAKDEEIYCEN